MKIKTRPETAHLFGCWCPLPLTAIPKSFHPVPSIYRAILVNIPSLKKEESRGKNKRKPKLQPYTARTHDGDEVRDENSEVAVSMSQVIAILLGAASPTLLQATAPLAGFSLGRLGWGLRAGGQGGPEERGGSSPGNTVHATGSQRISAGVGS